MTTTAPSRLATVPVKLALNWSGTQQARRAVDTPTGDVTTLLRAWSAGDRSVESRLFEVVLPDLRRLAQHFMRQEPAGQTLQASALLNEAYLRLVKARERDWESRRHFFAIAARVMRRLLIDHARGRPAVEHVGLEQLAGLMNRRTPQIEEALAIDTLLDELEAVHPELCQVVELRFFLGLTEEESAEALRVPLRTVQRRYSDARRWLFEKLENPGA
jgi:RNA polymerase sigma-70 factor (ECF subfamily)